MKYSLQLQFSEGEQPELLQVSFSHPLLEEPALSVRGKSAGAYLSYGSFQWTSGVKAIVLLCLKFALRKSHSIDLGSMIEPLLEGQSGSAAAALDNAISKKPLWLQDMFGVDSDGKSLLLRMLRISNPGHKRNQPVAFNVGPSIWKELEVEIRNSSGVLGGEDIESLLAQISPEEANSFNKANEIPDWLEQAITAQSSAGFGRGLRVVGGKSSLPGGVKTKGPELKLVK